MSIIEELQSAINQAVRKFSDTADEHRKSEAELKQAQRRSEVAYRHKSEAETELYRLKRALSIIKGEPFQEEGDSE